MQSEHRFGLKTASLLVLVQLPNRLLKKHFDAFGVELQNLINNNFNTGTFPDELNMGEISCLFERDDSFTKKNYRPITL